MEDVKPLEKIEIKSIVEINNEIFNESNWLVGLYLKSMNHVNLIDKGVLI